MKREIYIKTGLFHLIMLIALLIQAQVRPAHLFDNNMVLQREKPVKIWGMADPMEKVKSNLQVRSKQQLRISRENG